MPRSSRLASLALALALASLAGSAAAAAQPTARPTAPRVVAPEAKSLAEVRSFRLPALDVDLLLFEDELAAEGLAPGPRRFAFPHEVFLTPDNAGTWTTLDDGRLLWRLRVQADGATSLNFGFDRYRMPPGGRLTIYSPDATHWAGPFDARDHQAHGELWTPLVAGDDVVLEVVLPAAERGQLELSLHQIGQGYRDVLGGSGAGLEKSGSCNVDVVCPEGNGWAEQIRGVVALQISGFFACSGSLINNTMQDLKPFILTANHCGITAGNDQTVVAYYKYQNSTCRTPNTPSAGGPGNGPLTFSQSGGSVLRASFTDSDFSLIEMNTDPQASFDPFWNGWDRRDQGFPNAITIHHPDVEEKRISFENDPVIVTGLNVPGNTHLQVTDWDVGTTEPGSSGAPLFSPQQRIIGQLHGGFAACGNNDEDWFGRIARSWTGGGSTSTRLRDWLAPDGSGVSTLNGTDEAGEEPEPPAAPTNLVATVTGNTTAHLAWNDNANDEDDFELQMKTGNGSFQTLDDLPPNTTAVDVTGLQAGQTYAFRVRARNEAGNSAFSNVDTVTMPGGQPEDCVENATTLCLQDGRFKVQATWRSSTDSGTAGAERLTGDTGYFYFFNSSNVELVVKVLNACTPQLGNRFWVFAAGLTNVEVRLTVTDTENPNPPKQYNNPLGQPFQPIQDTSAFATCP